MACFAMSASGIETTSINAADASFVLFPIHLHRSMKDKNLAMTTI